MSSTMKKKVSSIINQCYAAFAALILFALTSCGGGSLEKQVKQALLDGDTTETRFQQICQLISSDSREYADNMHNLLWIQRFKVCYP